MIRRISSVTLLFCIILHCIQAQNWTHYTVLDGDGRFHLYWEPLEDKRSDCEIAFKVELNAKGYFGLGFSPNGGMPGSDIITGWIKDGHVFFQDRHAVDFSLPPMDRQQDYKLIKAYENDTFTVFVFCRKLVTCDGNDTVIDESTMRLIYAYSFEDPASDDPFYHDAYRGVKSAVLLESKYNEEVDFNLTSLLHFDMLSPGIDISGYDTLYWCKIFKTPNVSEKHHIVYIKPMIQKGHEQFVHHIGLYECVGGTPGYYDVFLDYRGHECWTPSMPPEMERCQGFTFTWGVGGEDTILPQNVGWPIYPYPGKYYLFEIHYDNPQLMSGIFDYSGYRFYYTPNLRKYDSGLLMIGGPILPRLFIPPRQQKYIVVGHSSPPCIPWANSSIKVFALYPHAHVITRAIKVRHFRGNKELKPITHDKNFDFKYQDFRFFPKEAEILPGDQITVECTYNSSNRSKATFGGSSTRDEMCMGFLLYYPLSEHYLILSAPSFTNINKVLGTNITKDADVRPVLQSYDWSNVDMDELQYVMRYSEHDTSCAYLDFPKVGVNPTVTYPNDLIPYEQNSTCNVTKKNRYSSYLNSLIRRMFASFLRIL